MIATFKTRVLPYGEPAIAEAARLIGEGLPVAVPTETVYGLAADATSGEAVARIYAAKGRPSFNPLIVHVADAAAAEDIAVFTDTARRLADRFWPGPLTMVLPVRGNRIASLVTAGLGTVAVRVPAARAMRSLLGACEVPLAAPSANPSGTLSPTCADHVLAGLGGRIALIIEDGATEHGVESTIVAVEEDRLRLLRPGPVLPVALEVASGLPVDSAASGMIEAPGQLASHYAPAKPLRLNAVEGASDEWLIGFAAVQGHATLSRNGDLVEAAARLFDLLHRADTQPLARIAVAPIPETGLGAAINDRLRRAAAPREA